MSSTTVNMIVATAAPKPARLLTKVSWYTWKTMVVVPVPNGSPLVITLMMSKTWKELSSTVTERKKVVAQLRQRDPPQATHRRGGVDLGSLVQVGTASLERGEVDDEDVAEVLPDVGRGHHEQRPVRVLVEVRGRDADTPQEVLDEAEARVEDELEGDADRRTRDDIGREDQGAGQTATAEPLVEQQRECETEEHRADDGGEGEDHRVPDDLAGLRRGHPFPVVVEADEGGLRRRDVPVVERQADVVDQRTVGEHHQEEEVGADQERGQRHLAPVVALLASRRFTQIGRRQTGDCG